MSVNSLFTNTYFKAVFEVQTLLSFRHLLVNMVDP